MDQKYFLIVFLILAALGLGVAGVSSLRENNNIEVSPTPAPENLIFNSGQNRDVAGIQNIPTLQQISPTLAILSPMPSPTPTVKAPKQYKGFPGVLAAEELKDKKAVIETSKGKIEFEIFTDSPKAASNFIFLTKDGFYDGLTFHRVVPGFVIQGGDPLGNGTGGPGYKFEDEPVTKKYDLGIVAMANAGPNTNGSQFFIMLADNPTLPPNYTIFGKVIAGQDVVSKIAVGDVMKQISIQSLK